MLTPDMITAMAPDAASFKAGKALAVASKWSGLGSNSDFIWGLAAGSGKSPYKTQVALDNYDSKCSCPSRKFPCKHALGLLFLAANDLSQLSEKNLPDWVLEWQVSRQARTEKQQKKKAGSSKKKSQSAKKQTEKTREKRESRVNEGIDFLDDFLTDIIRQGLGQVDIDDAAMWDRAERRLIDCQATGLASAVRRIGDAASYTRQSNRVVLYEMGALYLLVQSYRKREHLTEKQRAELEQRIGWQVDKETVSNSTRVSDEWFVAFRYVYNTDRVKVFTTWLYGQQTQQWALLLSFSAAGSIPKNLWPVGALVKTELAFYPGADLERAMPLDEAPVINMGSLPPSESMQTFLQRKADGLAVNPWRHRYPFILNAQVIKTHKHYVIADSKGEALPASLSNADYGFLSAICGGQPVPLAGEWDGYQCHIHAANDSGTWIAIRELFS